MPVTGLTATQQRVLDVIRAAIAATGTAPSYGELANALGTGKTAIHRAVGALVRRGHITRQPRMPRSMRLVGDPGTLILQLQPVTAARLHRAAAARGQRPEALVGELVAEFLRAVA
jgi:SOS-response transcriptional repressor LexA